jgi:hypothetical protein
VHRDGGLAVDTQRFPARGQDPQHGAGGEQLDGELGGGVDEVLAVVQHEQPDPTGERIAQGMPRLIGHLRQADGVGDRVDDHLGLADVGQPDQPRTVGVGQGGGVLDDQPGLTHPGRAHKGDQPLLGQQPGHGGQLTVAAEEGGQRPPEATRRGHAAGRCGRGCRGRFGQQQPKVLGQHEPLQPLQLRPGVDAELVGEQHTHATQRGERVALPATAVQPEDEQRPPSLAVRRGQHRRVQLGHRTRCVPR